MFKFIRLLLWCCFWGMGLFEAGAQSYHVHYSIADADSSGRPQLRDSFASRSEANEYLSALTADLQNKGFITASLDSLRLDSLAGYVQLYFGGQYQWARIRTLPADEDLLQAVRWPKTSFAHSRLDFALLQQRQNQLLDLLEENGHPFARIFLDSISLAGNEVAALLRIERGPLYKMDSIHVNGKVKISQEFLQRYLELPNGSVYNRKKLQEVDKRIQEISYITEEKPSALSFSASGAVLNLYLAPKRSSQVNVLIGLLPNTDINESKKFLVTGEANVLLNNSLGAGETIGLNWQQLQVKSPKLNLLYQHPYLFHSPVGMNFNFDMYRRDSSYVNITMQLGATYSAGASQVAQVFVLRRQTIVNGMDTLSILHSRRLPDLADVSSSNLGVSYSYHHTNYRYNPQSGSEFSITASAGNKKLKKNNMVLELKDPSDPSFQFSQLYDTVKLSTYQLRVLASGAHYFRTGKQTTLKTGVAGGIFQSGNYFLNELFMIGGYRLLRGFAEESQFVSQYAVGTLEYRYLIGLNSNFFAFVDGGWAKNPLQTESTHTYIGSGLGLSFETKAGIFNLAWAVGKRSDEQWNLRQSKIHFGFVNYF